MRLGVQVAVLMGLAMRAQAKAVFAHFMVTNTGNYTEETWKDEFQLAKQAHIDAFALNMGHGDATNEPSLKAAFSAVADTGFKLFFSFDYAAQGAWPKEDVLSLLKEYGSNDAYYQYKNKPFVSTFEGTDNADDWNDIKAQNPCFFVPDWSSKGASVAVTLGNGVADGLFNWGSWPTGPNDMTTTGDQSYVSALNGKPYMMPVSPWFYTNLPGYGKNWLWRGDNLWADRWQQVLQIEPEFVEIQTWNDYGESHYIGPVREEALAAFYYGKAPYDYAQNMPHDGWRATLPASIDLYKNGSAQISQEALSVWYRTSPKDDGSCSDGGTTGNTASQGQQTYAPSAMVADSIFFSVLAATKPSDITVSVGGNKLQTSWTLTPSSGAAGLYHGNSSAFSAFTGDVVVEVTTAAGTMALNNSEPISTDCKGGFINWNAWTGSAVGAEVSAKVTKANYARRPQICAGRCINI